MVGYAIAYDDEVNGSVVPCYWVCRFKETDNYTMERWDATVFRTISAARAMIETLGVEHYVVELK